MSDKSTQQAESDLMNIIKSVVKGAIRFEGIITAVNSDYTCEVNVNKTVFHKVPINVLKGKKASFYIEPKKDTPCLLTFKDGNIQRPTIVSIHEAEKLLIDCNETVFNGGTHGMVKIDELIKKINRIEDKLKDHQHAYIPYPSGSPGTPTATTKALTAVPPDMTLQFTNTKEDDLKDEKIKH